MLSHIGAFIKLSGDQVGILYKEEISNVRIANPRDKVKVGDRITVLVKKCDKDTGKLVFSLKDIDYSWQKYSSEICEGTTIVGIVRNKYKTGLFVEIMPNILGLANYKTGVSYGDRVEVLIKKVFPDAHKIKLEILD